MVYHCVNCHKLFETVITNVVFAYILLGSVIGSMILCFGFYTVIWGKARENTIKTVAGSEQSPLLLTHIIEDEAVPPR